VNVEADGHTIRACIEHASYLVVTQRATLRGVPRRCLACGALHPETFHTRLSDYEASLCEPHLTALLTYNLEPKAFRRLAKDAGDPEKVFHLHGDFYSPRGIALQPDDIDDWPPFLEASAQDAPAEDAPNATLPRPPQRGR
jgi:hypothetical protein